MIQRRQCSPDGRRGTPESLDLRGRLWGSEGLFLGGEREHVPTRLNNETRLIGPVGTCVCILTKRGTWNRFRSF